MSAELSLVVALLAVSIALLILNRPRMDVVAWSAIIVLPLLGIVTVPEAVAGFSDPNVILIAAMFVIGEGLVRTGVAHRLGDILIRQADSSETRLVVLLMLTVAGLGAFMSSTGIVAIFIPVVLNVARRLRIPPGRLMMPLSFAALISGMLTLVATAPNMVVDSALKGEGEPGLSFFSFTPIGLVVLLMGLAYMLAARRWLIVRALDDQGARAWRNMDDLIADYNLKERGRALRISPESPLIGRTLRELGLRRHYQANVVGVQRRAGFYVELLNPNANMTLRSGDVMLVDMYGPDPDALSALGDLDLETVPVRGGYFTDQSREIGMAEVMLPPDSDLIGKTLREASFRSRYGSNVVGLRRGGQAYEGKYLDEKLKLGDALLLFGPWKAILKLRTLHRDFVVLTLPEEANSAPPALSRSPYALLSLLTMVALMASGMVPNALAALIACMLMGLFGCVDIEGAYKAVHWQSVVLIVGLMPFAKALERTGGVALAVDGLTSVGGGGGPYLMLASLFGATAVMGSFVSNTVTAVLMAPVAINIAQHVGASPRPFVMIVALAASAAFMTPVSSPVNTLVLGPGNYRFMDFVRIGAPFTLLVLVVSVLLVPLLFPL